MATYGPSRTRSQIAVQRCFSPTTHREALKKPLGKYDGVTINWLMWEACPALVVVWIRQAAEDRLTSEHAWYPADSTSANYSSYTVFKELFAINENVYIYIYISITRTLFHACLILRCCFFPVGSQIVGTLPPENLPKALLENQGGSYIYIYIYWLMWQSCPAAVV